MVSFWIISFVFAGLAASILMVSLMRNRQSGDLRPDLALYHEQLRALKQDTERGTLSVADAEIAKIEISRRLLDADRGMPEQNDSATPNSAFAAIISGLVILSAYLLYDQLGARGYLDMSLKTRIASAELRHANRPNQASVELGLPAFVEPRDLDPRMAELMQKLRLALVERPNDLQGHQLLARNEAAMGNHVAAHKAQARIIAIKGDGASAKDLADYVDLLVLAAGGYVSPKAETALSQTLSLDPTNGIALYYTGLMFAQNGRPDRGFQIWDGLLKSSAQTDPWYQPLREQIESMAADAGVRYQRPEPTVFSGPTAHDITDSGQLSTAERNEMIQGMVNGLSERLATEGGPSQDWARLITALSVLGEKARAVAIWQEAQTVFASSASDLNVVNSAATQAGLSQ